MEDLTAKVEKEIKSLSFNHFSNGQSMDNIDSTLSLISGWTFSAGSADISWSAEPEGIIDTATGQISLPHEDTAVMLTAKFDFTESPDEEVRALSGLYKTFSLTVIGNSDPQAAVDAAYEDLEIEKTFAVKSDFSLPLNGRRETDILWSSDNESVISVECGAHGVLAKVTPKSGEDADVKLTAAINRENVSKTKTFNINVRGSYPAEVERAVLKCGEDIICSPCSGAKISGVYLTYESAVTDSAVLTVRILNPDKSIFASKDIPLSGKPERIDPNLAFSEENGASQTAEIEISENGNIISKRFEIKRHVIEKGKPVTIYVAGDSTASMYPFATFPRTGWAQALQSYFDPNFVRVDDRAISGKSSKDFRTSGHLKALLRDIKPGDYLIIQFGHNDEKTGLTRHTVPNAPISDEHSFRASLMKYINGAVNKGAHPIIASSISRLRTEEEPVHLEYVNAALEFAREIELPSIDLYQRTWNWIKPQLDLSKDEGTEMFASARDMFYFTHIDDKRYKNNGKNYTEFLKGGEIKRLSYANAFELLGPTANAENRDQSHLSVYGAELISKFAFEELKRICNPATGYAREYEPTRLPF